MKQFLNSFARNCALVVGPLLTSTLLGACAAPATAEVDAVISAPVSMQCLDIEGRSHDPSKVLASGKPVALVFWQSWCGSCVAEAPHVEQARRKFGERIEFYGVVSGPDQSVDEAAVRKVVFQNQLQYTQLRDRDGALSKHFSVQSTPTIVIIGADRQVLYSGHTLPEDWNRLLAK
mgnify:CR=1 FL=1|jgi:thiol-disulfide isomerase/thioredoxin